MRVMCACMFAAQWNSINLFWPTMVLNRVRVVQGPDKAYERDDVVCALSPTYVR